MTRFHRRHRDLRRRRLRLEWLERRLALAGDPLPDIPEDVFAPPPDVTTFEDPGPFEDSDPFEDVTPDLTPSKLPDDIPFVPPPSPPIGPEGPG